MTTLLAVGYGDCRVFRDDEAVYSEALAGEEYWTVQDAENVAAADPDHDWQIEFMAPLWDATYRRQGPGEWTEISRGKGFA